MIRYLLIIICWIYPLTALASFSQSDVVLDSADRYFVVGNVYNSLLTESKNVSDGNKILMVDVPKGAVTVLYQQNTNLDRLQLSPDGLYIAVLKGYSGMFGSVSELVVIDIKSRKEVLSFKDTIGKYVWSSDSKKIAYIAGGIQEGKGFQSNGVWVYDFAKKEKMRIADAANNIEWFNSDDIYVVDYREIHHKKHDVKTIFNSFIYDYSTGIVKARNLKGTFYSLDGKYSFLLDPNYRGYPMTLDERNQIQIDIYDLSADQIIPRSKLTNLYYEPWLIHWGSFMWMARSRVVFKKSIEGKSYYDILVVDPMNNKILKTKKGVVVGINSNRSKLVVLFEGKFEIMDVQ